MSRSLLRMKANVLKSLAHPTRLAMIEYLGAAGERCVCEIAEHVEGAGDRTTISKHLAVLRAAGLVSDRKEGLKVFYRLNCPCVRRFLSCIEQMVVERVRREHKALLAK
ncbi:MAG: metalloregulator ArsR/SmtB family transcription factor [Candidatus Sumerlaeia bacterium]|nr:metalloregulator ArsR/SmtB family transcription factor [Candidatus Sumerlaeia bacterium]